MLGGEELTVILKNFLDYLIFSFFLKYGVCVYVCVCMLVCVRATWYICGNQRNLVESVLSLISLYDSRGIIAGNQIG